MARRGTLLAYVRRDDTIPADPTVLVPASWALVRESSGWATVYPLGRTGSSVVGGQMREHRDVFLHAWLGFAHASLARACFVVVGHPYALGYLADRVAADALAWTRTWASLAELRADVGTTATLIKSAWRAGAIELPSRIAGFDDDDAEA